MIHIFIGTKAQYIKTAPVCRELARRNITYRLIDSGQHRGLSEALRATFHLPVPDIALRASGANLSSVPELLGWFAHWMQRATFRPRHVRRRIFGDAPGVCVVHGDTVTTLLSCYLARRAGLRVAHLEAGLRSRSWWHPFPEEIIRLITMRMADILFAPNAWAAGNLRELNVRGRIITLSGNTGQDAVRLVLGGDMEHSRAGQTEACPTNVAPTSVCAARGGEPAPGSTNRPYIVVTTHRVETIFSRDRLQYLLRLLADLSKRFEIRFVMHEPTRRGLVRFGLLGELERIARVQPLLEYPEFLRLVKGAAFVITDGGSIQEESFYLNVPCCILRMRTERLEGLESNALLSRFDSGMIADFVARFESFRRPALAESVSPSAEVVDVLVEEDARAMRGRVIADPRFSGAPA